MRRFSFLVLLMGLIIGQAALAQEQQPLLTVPHEWSISGGRWQTNGRDFWTWNRNFFSTAEGTYDYQDRLRLWNGDTGNSQHEWLYHGDNVAMYLDWSAGEDRVLVYSGQSLEIWNALRGEKSFTFDYSARISGARWNKNFSRILFWSYDDGTAHIWDTTTQQSVFLAETGLNSDLVAAAWSPDETSILSVLTQSPGRVDVWDVASGERKLSFEYPGMVYQAEWNSDGTRILITGDKIIQIIDVATQAVLLEKHDDEYLYRADWSPERKLVAVRVEHEPRLEVWDTHSGRVLASILHTGEIDNHIFEVLWSQDNHRLLTHSPDKITLLDISTGAVLSEITVEARAFTMSWLSWSPDENKILYMRSDSTMQIVTLESGEAVELELPEPIPLSLPAPTYAWNGDNSQVMLWGIDNAARIWDTTTGKLLASLEHAVQAGFEAALVTNALWSPDEQHILTLATSDYCGGSDTCPSEASVWVAP